MRKASYLFDKSRAFVYGAIHMRARDSDNWLSGSVSAVAVARYKGNYHVYESEKLAESGNIVVSRVQNCIENARKDRKKLKNAKRVWWTFPKLRRSEYVTGGWRAKSQVKF